MATPADPGMHRFRFACSDEDAQTLITALGAVPAEIDREEKEFWFDIHFQAFRGPHPSADQLDWFLAVTREGTGFWIALERESQRVWLARVPGFAKAKDEAE
jgi:hypothetical protein